MDIDKTSFADISIFHSEEEFSIFHKLNFTRTTGGKEWLKNIFHEPHDDLKQIIGTQQIIKALMEHVETGRTDITNGTILMMDKFWITTWIAPSANPGLFKVFYINGFTKQIIQW